MRPISLGRVLVSIVFLGVVALPARAGDADAVRRYIASAREEMNKKNFLEVEGELKHGEQYLDGLDAATRAQLEKDIAALRKEWPVAEQKHESERLCRQMDNYASTGRQDVKNGATRDAADKADAIEKLMGTEAGQKFLSADQRSKYQKVAAELRSSAKSGELSGELARVERNLKEVEDLIAKPRDDFNTDDYIAKKLENVVFSVKDMPQDDPRVRSILERVAKGKAELGKQVAAGAQAEAVETVLKKWEYYSQNGNRSSEGWDAETKAPSYDEFLHHSPMNLACEKTQKRYDMANHWFEDEGVKANLPKVRSNPKVKACEDEAARIREEAGSKVCSFANQVLDEVEKVGPSTKDFDDVKSSFSQLMHILEHHTKGTTKSEPAIARAKAILEKHTQAIAGAAKAKEALTKSMVAAAAELWPSLSKAWSCVDKIDAADALRNMGSWKGKHWKGQKPDPGDRNYSWNRSGSQYWPDYYFILPIDQIPIAGSLDPEVKQKVREIEQKTGLDVRDWDVDGVVVEIESACMVGRRGKRPFTEQEMERQGEVDGVKVRIVALWAGPFAAAVGKDSSLAKVDLSKVDPKALEGPGNAKGSSGGGPDSSTSSSGSAPSAGWWWVLALSSWFESFMCFLGGLAAALYGAARFLSPLEQQRVRLGRGVGYAGFVFAAFGAAWLLYTAIIFDFFPAMSLVLAGAFVATDHFRASGRLSEETAAKIQPAGILLGMGAWFFGLLHVFLFRHWFI